MNYYDFKKQLLAKDIYGPYLFVGQEGLMADEIIEYIKNTFINQEFLDLNYTSLHGEDLDLDNFYSAIETLPLMSDYRLILIYEVGAFYKDKKLSDLFYKSLDKLSKDTIVIFEDMDGSLKKNTKLYKYFKKNNRLVEFNKLKNNDLRRYIKNELKKAEKSMADGDISYFILQTGYDNRKLDENLYDLKSELDKLISSSPARRISKEDIDDSLVKVNDSNIFNLLDSLQEKNTSKALAYLHDLYEKDQAIALIIHMIQRRYRHLYSYSALSRDGYKAKDIQNLLGITSYEFKNISRSVYGKQTCDLLADLEHIYKTDKLLKSSSVDDLLLAEYLVVNLCKQA